MSEMLELRLLGRLDIHRNGIPINDLRAVKPLALLSYLAVTARPHTRSALAGLLWGGLPEAKARDNLSKALSTLRRVVGEYLTITRQIVAFNEESDFWLDVAEFEAGVSDHSIERLQAAVQIYEGNFLDGFSVRHAPEFEDWVLAQQARLKELALHAWHTLAAHFAEQGDTGRVQAVDYTRRLLTLDPWREEAHRQLMRLLALNGQRGAALAQYETCRQVLTDELSVEPGTETTALYEQIRDGQFGQKVTELTPLPESSLRLPASPHNLPPQPTSFIGRESELTALDDLIAKPEVRFITIVGPGGMGKTRFALASAERQFETGRFPNGIYFVNLAPLSSNEFLVSAIIDALNITVHGATDPKTQLFNYLQNKESLLVLDNFEHVLNGVAVLSEMTLAAPGVKLLVTSRERLNLQEEWVYDLQGMTFPETNADQTSKVSKTFEVLENDYSALQLFEQRARQAQATFNLAAEYPAVIRICQLVDGMPLGLELAASWINMMSCREIAVEIEQNLDFLTTSLRNVPERHRSLRAVFEHSWQLLSDGEKEVFKKLSVFRGGFTRPAAESITGAILHTLMALVNKSLIQPDYSGRYHIHELLRQFGAEKLAEARETGAIRDRHLTFFLKLAEEAEPHLLGSDQAIWLNRLELEHDNLRAAVDWSRTAENTTELSLRLVGSLALFWNRRSYMSEGREYLSAALSRPEASQRIAARAKALHAAGHLAYIQSDYPVTRPLLEESISIYQELDPAGRQGLADALITLGDMGTGVGDYATASSLTKEALGIMRELKDVKGIARALWQLGSCAVCLGDYEQAVQYLEEALPLWRQVGDKNNLATVLSVMAEVAARQGDHGRATKLEKESLVLRREIGTNWGIAVSLGNFAWIALRRGDLQQAVTRLGESLTLRREIGDRGGIAWCLEKLAEIALITGQRQSTPRRDEDFQRVVRLFGAAAALREFIGSVIDLVDQPEYERQIGIVQTYLDEATFTAAWAEGQAMTLEQAVDYALATDADQHNEEKQLRPSPRLPATLRD